LQPEEQFQTSISAQPHQEASTKETTSAKGRKRRKEVNSANEERKRRVTLTEALSSDREKGFRDAESKVEDVTNTDSRTSGTFHWTKLTSGLGHGTRQNPGHVIDSPHSSGSL